MFVFYLQIFIIKLIHFLKKIRICDLNKNLKQELQGNAVRKVRTYVKIHSEIPALKKKLRLLSCIA